MILRQYADVHPNWYIIRTLDRDEVRALLDLTLLGITLIGVAAPPVTVWAVHPATVLLLAVYVYGVRVSRQVSAQPMWQPEQTDDTDLDVPLTHATIG